jgi:hypothetical protein
MSEARRLTLEVRPGSEVNFGPDYQVASDIAVLIYDGAVLLGWADDYGTVRHPDCELEPEISHAAEELVEAAAGLWERLEEQAPSRGRA